VIPAAGPTVAATARPFTFDDYASIVHLSDAAISPDGRRIAVVVSRTDLKKDDYVGQIVLVDVPSGKQRVLTHGRDEAEDPQWSPDGAQLAFVDVAGEGKSAAPQVWTMPMNGGDAETVTHAKNGVELYAWRPDGKAIAYVTQDAPADQTALDRHEDLFKAGDDPFMTRSLPSPSHLWVQPLGSAAAERLTEGSWSVYADAISWSPDGRYIAFDRLPGARFDDILRSRTAVVDVSTRSVTQLGTRWSLLPAFAPHGDQLAFTQAADATTITEQNAVAQAPVGGRQRDLAPSLDRNVSFLGWSNDGTLLVAADDRVDRGVWRVRDGQALRVDMGDVHFDGGTISQSGALGFVGSTPASPGELYVLEPGAERPIELTHYNAPVAALDLAPTREFSWSNDGFTEYGPLTYPLGYRAGKRYPLVLVIHGGPTFEASTRAFNPLVQVLAAHGAFVLQPNYRGSDDEGLRYAYAIVGKSPPLGAGTDCVAAVKALEATGIIDPSRVGVSGWSGGGWLTSWLITHYDMWKAAVSGAAVDDAVMQYSLSQIDSYMPYLFGGLTPWKPGGMQAYRASSPVTYAADVNAPTLIVSDAGDQRVPTPEAYEFYAALRDLGKTVEFLVVPANGHHPSDPVRSRAVDEAWVDWMVKYLPLP